MECFDGTAARQLELVDGDAGSPLRARHDQGPRPWPRRQPLVKDFYRALDLRRRRAQIAARHLIEDR